MLDDWPTTVQRFREFNQELECCGQPIEGKIMGGASSLPRLYSIDEFRHILRVSRMTFYRLMRMGDIPAPFRIGSQWRFNANDVDQWLESKKKSSSQ